MNTRSLIELIVLNVGLENSILTPSLFSIMVFVTLITTSIPKPLLNFTGGKKRQ
jgi:Kef-type K+ transport system membrane component KefB